MEQQLFNNLVYWALKYYQVRMFHENDSSSIQMEAARYFFTTLWNASQNLLANDELINDVLNDNEIDFLAYQYRLMNDSDMLLEIQDYYTQLVVRKLNYYSHTYFSWTLKENESFSFWEHLLLTHQKELGVGLLSGIVSALTIIGNQTQLAALTALPGIGLLSWCSYYYYQWHQLHQNPLQISTRYVVNPHRQYKIWLSSTSDHEISEYLSNHINQNRQKDDNTMAIVYDKQLMTSKQYETFISFCERNTLRAINVRDEVFPVCKTEEEHELIRIYEQEIANLSNGGSLEIANQVLCWLRPIYELGIYSNLDIVVDLRNVPKEIACKQPILFNIDYEWNGGEKKINFNQDIIMVVNSSDAQELILQIQHGIVKANLMNRHHERIEKMMMGGLKQCLGLYIEDEKLAIMHQAIKIQQESINSRKEWIHQMNLLCDTSKISVWQEKKEEIEKIKTEMLENMVGDILDNRELLSIIIQSLVANSINKNKYKLIYEYSFENYDLADKFQKSSNEIEEYEKEEESAIKENREKEIRKTRILEEKKMESSAKIIQKFFRVKPMKETETNEEHQIGTDWELIQKM